MATIETLSPLALPFPSMQVRQGVHLKSRTCGLRYQGRDDLCAIVFDDAATIAGVYTSNLACGAPIDWNRTCEDKVRAIVVNAGNANAFTGRAGADMCHETAHAMAEILQCSPQQIYLASTGVIGEKPPKDYLSRHVQDLLQSQDKGWLDIAKSISTTDTFPKGAEVQIDLGGQKITLSGVAKGSGMIAPDMATMLSFVVTDAGISHGVLQKALKDAVDKSLNCVTVDSDCSTSDMVLLAAMGTAQHEPIDENSKLYDEFVRGLKKLLVGLAKAIAADGEGAKKFITIKVLGGRDFASAKRLALSIGNSPLVKTAVAGEDANWGRVVMAVGKSGVAIERDKLDIDFGDIAVARQGEVVDNYNEEMASAYMKNSHIDIVINVNLGSESAEVWTCDLTYDYIRINADYRS